MTPRGCSGSASYLQGQQTEDPIDTANVAQQDSSAREQNSWPPESLPSRTGSAPSVGCPGSMHGMRFSGSPSQRCPGRHRGVPLNHLSRKRCGATESGGRSSRASTVAPTHCEGRPGERGVGSLQVSLSGQKLRKCCHSNGLSLLPTVSKPSPQLCTAGFQPLRGHLPATPAAQERLPSAALQQPAIRPLGTRLVSATAGPRPSPLLSAPCTPPCAPACVRFTPPGGRPSP